MSLNRGAPEPDARLLDDIALPEYLR